jgi:hydrogenase expression/formation protein HypC
MCVGVPGEVLSVSEEVNGLQIGKVSFGGVRRDVVLTCVPDVRVGDWVLVHVGFAVSRIDRDEAERTMSYLRELGWSDPDVQVVEGLEVEGAG